jgi:hypothetical protein
MEPFGFDKMPEVIRLLYEKVERIEALLEKKGPLTTKRTNCYPLKKPPLI